MFINLHIYKVACAFNGKRREFLVVAHDMTSAEREALDFWDRHVDETTDNKSYRTESVSLLGAIVDCTGQTIAAQPA